MKKTFARTLALAAAGTFCLLPALPALAAPPAKSEIELLKQQVQMLMQQNQQLNQRLNAMEKQAQTAPGVEESAARHKTVIEKEVARQLDEKKVGPSFNEFARLSGSIEGDYKLSKGFDGAHTSKFVLDTVDLILDVKVVDWATGKVVLEYDGTEGNEEVYIDEAHVTLGNTEDIPFFLTGGKIYAPFGTYTTNMIQDPLTQTVGEINDAGVIAGYARAGFTGSVFTFNGLDDNDIAHDTVNGYGVSLAYEYKDEERGFQAAAAWVNNIAPASGIHDSLQTSDIDGDGIADLLLTDTVPGLALSAGGNYGPVSVTAEYVTALDSFTAAELAFGTEGAQPSAMSGELTYTTAIMNKETVFAIGYQQSWEAVALGLPEHRYIGSAAVNVLTGTTITMEYYYDQDYDLNDGGTDNNGHGFTTRLAYEF